MNILQRIFNRFSPARPTPPSLRPGIFLKNIDNQAEAEVIAEIKTDLANGKDPNAIYGGLPLHAVCAKGFRDAAELLLDAGADPNARGAYDETPFMAAAKGLNPDLLKLLIRRDADTGLLDRHGNDALQYFVHFPDAAALQAPDAKDRDRQCLRLLLGLDLHPLERSDLAKLYTARPHLAAEIPALKEAQDFEALARRQDMAGLRKKLDDGVPPDCNFDYDGVTALKIAAENNNVPMMNMLMAKGANIEAWSGGMTPIMAAVLGGAKDAFLRLLEADADTTKTLPPGEKSGLRLAELADKDDHPGMRAFVEEALARHAIGQKAQAGNIPVSKSPHPGPKLAKA